MRDWITLENADIVMAWATVAGVVVAFFAALFALSQLRMIRKDSRERTRPYVQLDVVPGLHGPGSWDLIIENRGASTALEVVIDAGDFAPLDAEDHIAPILGNYLLTPKTLIPGARRRVMWGFEPRDRDEKAGVLEPREATVSYFDERTASRRWLRRAPYLGDVYPGRCLRSRGLPCPDRGQQAKQRGHARSH